MKTERSGGSAKEQLNTDFGAGLTVDGVPAKNGSRLIESGRHSGLWSRAGRCAAQRHPNARAHDHSVLARPFRFSTLTVPSDFARSRP